MFQPWRVAFASFAVVMMSPAASASTDCGLTYSVCAAPDCVPDVPAGLPTVELTLDNSSQTYSQTTVSLYLWAPAPELLGEVTGRIVRADVSEQEHLLVRAFDELEQPILWRYTDTQLNERYQATVCDPEPPYIAEHLWTPDLLANPLSDAALDLFSFELAQEQAVYELRIMGGERNSVVELWLPPGVEYGLRTHSIASQWLHEGSQLTEAWMFAPRHPTASVVADVVWDPRGDSAAESSLSIYDATTLPEYPIYDSANPELQDPLSVAPDPTFGGDIWRLDLPPSSDPDWNFQILGMPTILVSSREAAEAIQASIVDSAAVPGGPTGRRLLSHQVQHDIAALLVELLQDVGVAGDMLGTRNLYFQSCTSAAEASHACCNPADIAQTGRSALLMANAGPATGALWSLGEESYFTPAIPHQDVDPTSQWGGSLGTSHLTSQHCIVDSDCTGGASCIADRCDVLFSSDTDRWDVLRRLPYDMEYRRADHNQIWWSGPMDYFGSPLALWAGNSPWHGRLVESMIWAASEAEADACNPFSTASVADRDHLFRRGVAAALLDLLALQEDELWRGRPGEHDSTYVSRKILDLEGKTLPAFAAASPHLEDILDVPGSSTLGTDIQGVWSEAVRRIIDRQLPQRVMEAHNKTAGLMVAIEQFHRGSEIELYRDLARSNVRRFVEHQDSAGYFAEEHGPGPSYAGITNYNLGHYYRLSELTDGTPDPVAGEALTDAYDFWNHTVAPEPGGHDVIVGGFNFAHRVATGVHAEQYRGARALADDLGPVALWHDYEFGSVANLDELIDYRRRRIRVWAPDQDYYNPQHQARDLVHARFWDPARQPVTLPQWPAQEMPPGAEDLGGLIAVRTKGYYATAFIGADRPFTPSAQLEMWDRLAQPTNKEAGGPGNNVITNLHHEGIPFNGGGLSMVWSEDYGTSVLATGWSPATHHGLLAIDSAGNRYWEDYWQASVSLDTSSSPAVMAVHGRLLLDVDQAVQIPLEYVRVFEFENEGITATITLYNQAGEELSDFEFFETLPFALCDDTDPNSTHDCDVVALPSTNTLRPSVKRNEATLKDASGAPLSTGAHGPLFMFEVSDANGHGLEVDFGDLPQPIEVSTDYLRQYFVGTYSEPEQLQVGWARVPLAPPSVASSSVLQYTLTPF